MPKLVWDKNGERLYETGVEQCALYPMVSGAYPKGVAWNGITNISESPSGAEANPVWADNKKYLNLISAEEFGASLGAYMYPEEFAECDGSKEVAPGVYAGQQSRKPFGLAYKTLLGNDEDMTDYGYKLHLIWNALAAPSEKGYSTVNDSPEAIEMSWELSTTPTEVGIAGIKPTANFTIDSTKTTEGKLAAIEKILFGFDVDEFSEEKTYAVGDYVNHATKVYICTTAVTVAGEWDDEDWEETTEPQPHLPSPKEVIELMGE